MGASDSKLVFKKGIFRLSEEQHISMDDPFWNSFWELPERPEDVFTLFSTTDIRRTRDKSPANFKTLISKVISRLLWLRQNPSFPDTEILPERDALNCIRILTRLLPFIYEADHLEQWEDKFFWKLREQCAQRHSDGRTEVLFDNAKPEDETPINPSEEEYKEVKPLGHELLDVLVDFLFFAEFTLPRPQTGNGKVTYSIWQSGVGCNNAVGSSKEFESNRSEVLRLLLTLTSKAMYMPASSLPVTGVEAITYLASSTNKQLVLSVLCSLLNTTLKFNPVSWSIPYDHVVFKDPRQTLVTYSLQLLLVLISYPIPEVAELSASKNYYRHFLGRLHRPQDFQFLVSGMTRILQQPMNANSSYLPGSQKSLKWAPEMIMLFWEALQSNKRFRSFIIDTNRSHDFVVVLLFHAMEYKLDPSRNGVVRMCAFVLQTLSAEPSFGVGLNKKFEGQESLPQSMRIPNFFGTYADFLIISIHSLIMTSKGALSTLYPALLAIINNVAAYLENLNAASSGKLLQLFGLMSSPGFLLANESNHKLLESLLESMNAIVEHQYTKNPIFVYAVLHSRKKIEALRMFSLETGQHQADRIGRLGKSDSLELDLDTSTQKSSMESVRSPASVRARTYTLQNVPENDDAFAIGDDEESDDGHEIHPLTTPSSPPRRTSQTPSVSSSIDEAVPSQVRGMSEKARGKMPAGATTFSRQHSTTSIDSHSAGASSPSIGFVPTAEWLENWLPLLPLHTLLTLVSELTPQLESSYTPTAVSSILESAQPLNLEASPIYVHLFEWSPLSLGWYESLLWSLIFTAEMDVSTQGTVGVWNGTVTRLFRVQEVGKEGPSLMQPRGMVDAVGSNLVNRVTNLKLRGPTQDK